MLLNNKNHWELFCASPHFHSKKNYGFAKNRRPKSVNTVTENESQTFLGLPFQSMTGIILLVFEFRAGGCPIPQTLSLSKLKNSADKSL